MYSQDIIHIKILPPSDSEKEDCKKTACKLLSELNGVPFWKAQSIIAEMAIALELCSKVNIIVLQKSE